MKIYIDSSDIEEIKNLYSTGLIDGVTTNPSLLASSAKVGQNFGSIIRQILEIVSGSVSLEVVATSKESMITEGDRLAKLGSNVTIKLPLTKDGLEACRYFSKKNVKTNVTLCFSANQALLAAKAGATYISPFLGRLDDIASDGLRLVEEIKIIYSNYNFDTKILAASIRSPQQVCEVAKIGVDVATLPAKVIWQLYQHPLTDIGLDKFLTDWKKSGLKL